MSYNSKTINTRISGVMSGGEWETRQLALEYMRGLKEEGRRVYIDLVPQWDNPYDPDALQAFVDLPQLGRVQVGFVANGKTVCDFCGHTHERYPKEDTKTGGPPRCAKCGHHDQLRRDGAASVVSQWMRRDPTARFYGEVLDVTGGVGDKNFGCNIVIRQSIKKP